MSEVTLWGIREQVFGGYNCLRGYTTMPKLIEISEAQDYQRKLIDEHIEEITEFYKNDKYLFFPEIILACEIDDPSFLINMQLNYSVPLYSTGVKYKYFKSNGNSELKIDNERIKLHIIDGNHRLNAFVKTPFDENKQVPFCILFLLKGLNNKDASVIFNNINYKHKPLELEDNLKIIFSDTFSEEDKDLKTFFGLEYALARKLCLEIQKNDIFYDFKRIFPKYMTACYKFMEFIKKKNQLTEDFLDKHNIVSIIKNSIFENLKNTSIDLGLFIALLYIKLFDEDNYMYFLNWVKKYKIIELNNLNPDDIINISKSIKNLTSKQIFVSMPFGINECDDMYNAVCEVVKSISNKDFTFPKPIRVDSLEKGHTYPINDEILSNIENAGYIIADLTYQRQNVYHEIGYAMGYIKGKGLKENLLLVMKKPPEGEEHSDKYEVSFNLRAYDQIRYETIMEFKEKLKNNLLKHFLP